MHLDTHLRDLDIKNGQTGVIMGGGKGKHQRHVCRYSPELTVGHRREEDSVCRCLLCGPEHFSWSGQHIIPLNPAIGADTLGKRPNTEV